MITKIPLFSTAKVCTTLIYFIFLSSLFIRVSGIRSGGGRGARVQRHNNIGQAAGGGQVPLPRRVPQGEVHHV